MDTMTVVESGQPEGDTEVDLIRRAKQNDRGAFAEIVRLYQKRIFRLAFLFFRDRDDAQEILQETFLRVYQKLARFQEDTSFSGWIHRLATNLCIDHYRKNKKRIWEPLTASQLEEREPTTAAGPEQNFNLEMFREKLGQSLSALSGRQRKVFLLKHFGPMTIAEISSELNISEGTVKTLHHRAMARLRQKMAGLEGMLG